jgi:hypothetical protein
MQNFFKRNLFDEDTPLPVDIHQIESYMQILLPLYAFSNDLQSDKAHIGLVVPAVLSLIFDNLDRMVLTDEHQNTFRNDLIKYLKIKFNDELSSKEHLVAAVLNVSFLSEWSKRSWAIKYFQAGLDSLFEILNKYTFSAAEDETNELDDNNNKITKMLSQTSLNASEGLKSLRNITRTRIVSDSDDLNKQSKSKILKDEIKVFLNIIKETKYDSTKKFWLKYQISLPNLFNLSARLLSIPATSAFIERYFSITGQINDKTTNSMSPELLKTKSMLKANIKLLD